MLRDGEMVRWLPCVRVRVWGCSMRGLRWLGVRGTVGCVDEGVSSRKRLRTIPNPNRNPNPLPTPTAHTLTFILLLTFFEGGAVAEFHEECQLAIGVPPERVCGYHVDVRAPLGLRL